MPVYTIVYTTSVNAFVWIFVWTIFRWPDGRGRSDAGVMKAEGKAGQGCSAPILINVALIAMMMAVRFF